MFRWSSRPAAAGIINAALAGLCLLLTGCTVVVTREPVGLKPAPNLERFEGNWAVGDGVVSVKRTPQGELIAGICSWDTEKQEFQLHQLDVVIRTCGDQLWLNVKERQPQPKPDGYLPMALRINEEGRQLELVGIDVNALKAAIARGDLQEDAKGKSGELHLAADAQQLDAFFSSPAGRKCLQSNASLKVERVPQPQQ